MKKEANLVIIGGGIVGASAAWHLWKQGWKDMVIVDQGPLWETGGSTSHAPGLIFQTNGSKLMCKMAQYTVQMYRERDTGTPKAWYETGGIEVARTTERVQELKRRKALAASYGLEGHIISPKEAAEKMPLLDPNAIKAAYWIPSDGDAPIGAWRIAGKLANEAIAAGALEAYGGTWVEKIDVQNGKVQGVQTKQGYIKCNQVLLATNIWGKQLAEPHGVNLPLMAAQHIYAVTEPLAELAGETDPIRLPIMRDQDHCMYYRQHKDSWGIGSYQHEPLLVNSHEIGKDAMRPYTPEHMESGLASSASLFPASANKELVTKFNGMFTFSMDGNPIMGQAPHINGFWTCIGVWVTQGGGAGKLIAEWMTEGEPTVNAASCDINRFHPHSKSPEYTYHRVYKQYDEVYDILHPGMQVLTPRNLRTSPFTRHIKSMGGEMWESNGWERPQWVEENSRFLEQYDDQVPHRTGWEAMCWSRVQGAEHLAARDNVSMYDLTNFGKIQVTGSGAGDFLEYMAANKIQKKVGSIVYTALCNKHGKIKQDLTVARTGEHEYLVLTGGGFVYHDIEWLRRHAPTDGTVTITDLTSSWCTIGLWGPKARDVLSAVTSNDVSNEGFPYFTTQEIYIGSIPVRACRLSYIGELGWELYTEHSYGEALWDTLWEAGKEHGIFAGGFGAFDSLRLEKGYRGWGSDISTDYTPYEAGLGWAVKLKKGDFLGRDALVKAKEAGLTQKLCAIVFDEGGRALGSEPVYDMDGNVVSYLTSSNYGYSVGKWFGYCYLPISMAEVGTRVQVDYLGTMYSATVSKEPLFDPKMEKLKC